MKGLTTLEVQERIQEGKVNTNDQPITRSYKQIILSNTLTFFNFLNIALFVLVILVGSYKNSMFMGVIICNTVIGIVQEIRAKKTIDELAIMTQSKAVVIREDRRWSITTDKLVLDDLVVLKTGDQIPADCEVMEGDIEVNESLLTGEADNLSKSVGDELFSGSFVTAGEAVCRVIHVGADNYASRITSEAKEFRKHNSELRNSLNAILRVISIIIVPMGALLFYKQYFVTGEDLRTSVVSTVAAVLGMIPEGLILLTSIALTLGAVKLAMRKTLVQELYCIESLARVDTLCLDKTGTITEGTMEVQDVIPYPLWSEDGTVTEIGGEDLNAAAGPESEEGVDPDALALIGALPELELYQQEEQTAGEELQGAELGLGEIERIMGNLMAVLKDQNATAAALRQRFSLRHDMKASQVIPFSSDRKFSGASFQEEGTWLIGAVQFLFPEGGEALKLRCSAYAEEGLRVLVLAHSDQEMETVCLPENLRPAALLVITDVIRPEAPDTLAYFRDQGVDLKIISGDDPVTVSAIAKRAGLPGSEKYVDATTLATPEDMRHAVQTYSVFGRVTPQQKKEMVLALKEQGHTVAMTGDGVNDVLALKEADCSIAMAAGSDAAKNVANVVLLDSNFASMPDIVNQGRRVVNNIRTAASMFLIKTMFSVMISLITIFAGDMYPFEPIQMSLISACAVGIPTFFLAQENNFEKIDHTFLRHVFMNAFPAAMTITGCVVAILIVNTNAYERADMLRTACFLVTGWNYMAALRTVYAPLNTYRKTIIYSMQLIFFTLSVMIQNILSLKSMEYGMIVLVFVLMMFSPLLIELITNKIRKLYATSLDGPGDTWIHRLYRKVAK